MCPLNVGLYKGPSLPPGVFTRLVKTSGGSQLNARAYTTLTIPADTAGELVTTYGNLSSRILFGAVAVDDVDSFMNSTGIFPRLNDLHVFIRGISNTVLRMNRSPNQSRGDIPSPVNGIGLKIARDAAGVFVICVNRNDGNGWVDVTPTGFAVETREIHMGVAALQEGSELSDISVNGVNSTWEELINFTGYQS